MLNFNSTLISGSPTAVLSFVAMNLHKRQRRAVDVIVSSGDWDSNL